MPVTTREVALGWVHCPWAQFEMRLFLGIQQFQQDPPCWLLPHILVSIDRDSDQQQGLLLSGALSCCNQHAQGTGVRKKAFTEL